MHIRRYVPVSQVLNRGPDYVDRFIAAGRFGKNAEAGLRWKAVNEGPAGFTCRLGRSSTALGLAACLLGGIGHASTIRDAAIAIGSRGGLVPNLIATGTFLRFIALTLYQRA